MLLVGALSSCHMLWFLALARKKGFEVASYEDDAEGDPRRQALHPATSCGRRSRWAGDPPDAEAIDDLHHRSHELCFISNSVEFPVEVEPA